MKTLAISRLNRLTAIRARIRKLAWQYFDESEFYRGINLLDRYNCLTLAQYPGEKWKTPGDWLNAYLEERTFESRM